ncbi:IMPACT family protein [Nocardioides sp. CPCC 205120]|uniref:IMPACT family protein n=1 Tax=Nocardioides sp. CPCC 205120 TaxID=3406462 RepID=UPI003B509EE3
MTTSYLVPAGDGAAVIEVRRSRFLATVRRTTTEDEARAVVDGLRRRHPDARHHCSALALGPWGAGGSVQRASDDGEPAGTAGAPMLDVLRGREVGDVTLVVTRWFGGVLLGAGGLVRAYGDAARAGVDAAGLRRRSRLVELELAVDHGAAGRLESDLRSRGVAVLDVAYGAGVVLRVGVPDDGAAALERIVGELSAGAVRPVAVGESWVDGPVERAPGRSTSPST